MLMICFKTVGMKTTAHVECTRTYKEHLQTASFHLQPVNSQIHLQHLYNALGHCPLKATFPQSFVLQNSKQNFSYKAKSTQ